MKRSVQSHQFAIYWAEIFHYAQAQTIAITDAALYHRIVHVLRLTPPRTCILFDRLFNILVGLERITSSTLELAILEVNQNTVFHPIISFFLPLLKRHALEEAVYALTECGVNEIRLLITKKVQREWYGEKELTRLQNIIIAASEQAKFFTFPLLQPPQSFHANMNSFTESMVFVLEPDGELLHTIFPKILQKNPPKITLFSGPEGGFTEDEKQTFCALNIPFLSLTPTILRAQQAATLGAGIMRSWCK